MRTKVFVEQLQPGADGEQPTTEVDTVEWGPGVRTYTHTQAVPAATWIIVHGLGRYPSVSVFDSADEQVEGDIVHDSNDQMTITFSGAFSGIAYVGG